MDTQTRSRDEAARQDRTPRCHRGDRLADCFDVALEILLLKEGGRCRLHPDHLIKTCNPNDRIRACQAALVCSIVFTSPACAFPTWISIFRGFIESGTFRA